MRVALGAIFASLYQDANTMDAPPVVDAPTPDIPVPNMDIDIRGIVQVPGRSIVELNGILVDHLRYNELMIEELCNHPTRMLFRNMMHETSFALTRNMPLLRREFDRVIFRLIEEQENEEPFGHENVWMIDMPYRKKTFVQNIWTAIGSVYIADTEHREYWRHVYNQEQIHAQLELEFQTHERAAGIGADATGFPDIINNRRVQRESD